MDKNAGLMQRAASSDSSEFLAQLNKVFGPSQRSKPRTLEQKLKALNEQDLRLVLSTAEMVKVAHGFTRSNTEPYTQLVLTMYPRLNVKLRTLIAELLQSTDPVPQAVKHSPMPDKPKSIGQDGVQFLMTDTEPTAGPTNSTTSITDDFVSRLTMRESGGNSQAEITIKDGRRFVGKLQFGEARLADYKKATGQSFTQDEFKANEALQDEVAKWHFADIDKAIDALGVAAKSYSRDGLKAVAHLGGNAGMAKYVRTNGVFNPADELGTSLQDYYDKFSS